MSKPVLTIVTVAGLFFIGLPRAGLGAETHDPNLAPLQPIVGQWKLFFNQPRPRLRVSTR